MSTGQGFLKGSTSGLGFCLRSELLRLSKSKSGDSGGKGSMFWVLKVLLKLFYLILPWEFPKTTSRLRAVTSFRLILPPTRPPVTAESVGVTLGVGQHKLSVLHWLSRSPRQLTKEGTALALGDNSPSCFAAPEANLQFYSTLVDFFIGRLLLKQKSLSSSLEEAHPHMQERKISNVLGQLFVPGSILK